MNQKGPDYWSFFNAFGKLVGLAFAVGCGLLAIWSFATDQMGLTEKLIGGGLSALMSVLGVLMIIAKPTRPTDTK
jgi:hypothetical protein